MADDVVDDAVWPGFESLLDEHPTTPLTSAAAVALNTARRTACATTRPPDLVVNSDQPDAMQRW